MKRDIGKKLMILRGNRTRREVANALGISISAIRMYENGQRIPRDDIKVKLAKYYGVSVDNLFYADLYHDAC
jgi:putative transcriptional regulator